MSELADCVDIGKSTLYEYFSNKDEIIKAAIVKYVESSIDSVDISSELVALNFEDAFKKQLEVLLIVASDSRSVLETLTSGFIQKLPESMKEEIKTKMEGIRQLMFERFSSFFIKGMQEGVIPLETDLTKGYIVTSLVVGSIFTFSDSRNKLSVDTVIHEIYEAILKILH